MIWAAYVFAAAAGVFAVWYASREHDQPIRWVPPSRELMVERVARRFHEHLCGCDTRDCDGWRDAYRTALLAVDRLDWDEAEL